MAMHGGGGGGGGRPPWHRVRFKHLLIAAGTAYFCFMYLFHSNLQFERPFGDADRRAIIGEEAFGDDHSHRRNVRNAGQDDAARQEMFDSIRLPQVPKANRSGTSILLEFNQFQDVSSPDVNNNKNSRNKRNFRLSTRDLDQESLKLRFEVLKLARHRLSSYNLNIPPRCLASPTYNLRTTFRSSPSRATNSSVLNTRHSSWNSTDPRDLPVSSPGENSTSEMSTEELRRRYNARLPFAAPVDVFAEDDFRFQELTPMALVYSAYLDDRPNDFDNRHNGSLVRMMFIMKTKNNQQLPLYCVFNSGGDGSRDGTGKRGPAGTSEGTVEEEDGNILYVSKVSQYYEMCENHNKQLGGFILSCHVPIELQHPPCYVTLYTTDPSAKDFDITDAEGVRVPIRSLTYHFSSAVGGVEKTVDEPLRKFTVCVPPLFGHVNNTRLIEFVEFATSVGFEKIVFYVYEIRDDILEILKYYTSGRSVVEIVPWDLPADINRIIWYHGQLVAIQDCLYRNMALSSYVAFMDIDELLVPRQFDSWSSQIMVIDAEDRCGFQFVGAYFDPFSTPTSPKTNIATEDKQGTQDRRRNSILDTVYILNSFKRTQMLDRVRTKCMVKPRLIFEKGIHHISKPIWSHLKVIQIDPLHAVLHHYKTCTTHGRFSDCSSFIRDESVLKFAGRAVRSLVQTHNRIAHLRSNNKTRNRIVVL